MPTSFVLLKSVMCRPGLICASPVEVPYYSADIGHLDICSLCGATEAVVYDELKEKYRSSTNMHHLH